VNRELLGSRGLDELRDELSGRDVAIVGQVADLRLMSARQIEAVHFSADEHANADAAARACRRSLERLTRERLIIRIERRIGGVRAGSRSYVYALGPVGHRVLALSSPRPRYREPSTTFIRHTLAVAQLVVDVTVAARSGSFDLLVCQTEPRCWRQFSSAGGITVLRPDLFLSLGVGEYERRFFVEVDQGTEHLPALIRKCRLYESYYRSGTEQAAHDVFPRVAWVVPDERRMARLRKAISTDRHLTDAVFSVSTASNGVAVLTGAGS
jgi:hypothetical protein